MSRVTISRKAAHVLYRDFSHAYDVEDRGPDQSAALEELRLAIEATGRPRRAMEPKRKPRKPLGTTYEEVRRRAASRTKREHRASIREAVFKRSEVNGQPRCEGPMYLDGSGQRCANAPTQLAHAFGRGKGRRPESVENCMAFCVVCAHQETNNVPDAGFWWNFRAEFFERNGYAAEARAARDRLAFVETRSTLGAGLKERARGP